MFHGTNTGIIQRRMRIEMALNELSQYVITKAGGRRKNGRLGLDDVTSGVLCGQVWTNYPRGRFFIV